MLGLALGSVPAFADHTGPLVAPEMTSGNFRVSDPGDDQQLCFDIFALPPGSPPWQGEIVGFKVDDPGPGVFSDGVVSFTISGDGRLLSWETPANIQLLGVVVKGGPQYNTYDYWRGGEEVQANHDNNLKSPVWKKNLPQISHYNVCYAKRTPPQEVFNGCSQGYWRNHAERWLGVSPADNFDATFNVSLFGISVTLGRAIIEAINPATLPGPQRGLANAKNAFARQAVAALLNAHGGVPNTGDGATVNYTYDVDQVKAMVQAAVAAAAADPDNAQMIFNDAKDVFEAANTLKDAEGKDTCPLTGTNAVPVMP